MVNAGCVLPRGYGHFFYSGCPGGAFLAYNSRMDSPVRRLKGANMDIDLATPAGEIAWQQDGCPWNLAEGTLAHRCAVKNVSICPYFRGVEWMDVVVCSYPNPDPKAGDRG